MYPKSRVSLDYTTPLELLVATILAARATDVRINELTKDLFRKYRTAADYANAKQAELERDIHGSGFFRNKASSLIGATTALVQRHGGEVPSTMEELVQLPGVGRKTANVVLGNAFGKAVGIVVDTHVTRVAGRLGLTAPIDPVEIEHDLMAVVPQKEWVSFAHRMIDHGRAICIARKPKCRECALNDVCPSAEEPQD